MKKKPSKREEKKKKKNKRNGFECHLLFPCRRRRRR
jgi:hypothetical protein